MITCGNCGSTNEDTAARCTNCGHAIENVAAMEPSSSGPPPTAMGGPPPYGGPPMYGMPRANVPNYLAQSIIVTLLCCLPAGIPAIVYAAQANGKQAAGDIVGAMDSAAKAKTWCWVSLGLGLAWMIIWLVVVIAGTATTMTTVP